MSLIQQDFLVTRRLGVRVLPAVLGVAGLLAFAAAPASAADSFGCRGSAVRLTGLLLLLHKTANGRDPLVLPSNPCESIPLKNAIRVALILSKSDPFTTCPT